MWYSEEAKDGSCTHLKWKIFCLLVYYVTGANNKKRYEMSKQVCMSVTASRPLRPTLHG